MTENPDSRGDQRLDLGDGGGEHRFVGQQLGAHRRPLRALPGEHPYRAAVVLADRGRRYGVSLSATSRNASASSSAALAVTAVRTGRCARRRARV